MAGASYTSFSGVPIPSSISSQPMSPASADSLLNPLWNLSLDDLGTSLPGNLANSNYVLNGSSAREDGFELPGLYDQRCNGSCVLNNFSHCPQCSTRTLPLFPRNLGFSPGLNPSLSSSSSSGSRINNTYPSTGFQHHGLELPGLYDQSCSGICGPNNFSSCLLCSAQTLPLNPRHLDFAPGLYPNSSSSSSFGSLINNTHLSSGFQIHENPCSENFLGSSVLGPYRESHGGSSLSSLVGNPVHAASNGHSLQSSLSSLVGNPVHAASNGHSLQNHVSDGRSMAGSTPLQNLGSVDYGILDQLEATDMVSMALDQQGSRFLQKFLYRSNARAVKKIFDGLKGSFDRITEDQFGTFLFQKLLQVCSYEQLGLIVLELASRSLPLIALSISEYGSRSVQRLITRIKKENTMLQTVISALSAHLLFVITHPVGFRVIQHCLKHLEYHQKEFIFSAAISFCHELGRREKGCICLIECVNHSRWPHREPLLLKTAMNSFCLSQDPYGNYLVQYVIELDIPKILNIICDKLKDHYYRLSRQKSGSHVVEMLLKSCRMKEVLSGLLRCSRFSEIALNEYGNYIIQTAWKVTKDHPLLRQELMEAMKPFWRSWQYHLHGKNVYNLVKSSMDNS